MACLDARTSIAAEKREFLRASLSANTFKTYNTGLRQYTTFCAQLGVTPFPLADSVLEDFCVVLSRRVGYKTIKVYLCGVQLASRLRGHAAVISDMPRLYYLLRGIRRSQGRTHMRPRRIPVTIPQLRSILRFTAGNFRIFDRDMLTAALLLAFFGMLRISEYTVPASGQFDPFQHLGPNDIRINWFRQSASIYLRQSKSDPFREGVTVRVAATGNDLCPLRALTIYLLRRRNRPGPLFVFHDNTFLRRSHVAALLQQQMAPCAHFNTHSLRQGGATALAAAGTPQYVIQILGRWRSDAFKRYLEFSDEFIGNANRAMAGLGPSSH